MRMLVTGGYGFLGNHICKKLESFGINEIKDINENTNGFYRFHKKNFNMINKNECLDLIEKFNPNQIIHAAARVGGIGANKKYPADYFYENVMMGINLIDSCKNKNVEKITLIGTVCSYPKITQVPFKESSLWDGYPEETNAPYGIAKKALLTQAMSYKEQYGLNFNYIIPVNLYGIGDNFDDQNSHVIPALIKKFVNAKNNNLNSVEVWGTGNATREFLYVDDAAEAIVKSINKDFFSPMNIGSEIEMTIKQIVAMIKTFINYNGDVIFNSNYPDGQPRRCLDTTLSKKILGNYAKTSLYDGLKKTIDWYCSK
jgi:GDP-L-fucose synthase